jgi:hypothetical protein
MTLTEFISRWQNNPASERAGAQAHFIDLCALLGVEAPYVNPNEINDYAFERGAKRTGAGDGWADVWKRNHFAWEYKKPHGNLGTALKQLMTYALALDNPPLLVVSDRLQIHIHTHFTGTPSECHTILLEHIGTPENLQKLRWLFTAPHKFKPEKTTAALTYEAANLFGDLALRLQQRGHDPRAVAHFLNKVLFCLFAEDAKAPGQDPLLPDNIFTSILNNGLKDYARFERQLKNLFAAMKSKDGEFGVLLIEWFNGGLFDDDLIIPLEPDDILKLANVARLDWSQIEPSIFGTLFERGLNPKKRSQLGANYTDPQTIMRLVDPVVNKPLVSEWEIEKARIAKLMDAVHAGEASAKKSARDKATKALKEATAIYIAFIERLKSFRVLDPACGSGNFLYMALQSLKDIELRVMLEAEELGLERGFPQIGPDAVLGIELDPYAAELARVTVWIGEIQWMLKHGFQPSRNPILKSLNQIECRDALLVAVGDGNFVEADWPEVDVIVGNPPFLGDKKMRGELGNDYVGSLRSCYGGRVPGGADLVTYWFEKARAQIAAGKCSTVGLVATNSIRQSRNRVVLESILKITSIFEAWSDEEWINEGAAVRVSLVCFGSGNNVLLDGKKTGVIYADLTGSTLETSLDLTKAKPLATNKSASFFGLCLAGKFKVDTNTALRWLKLGGNPNGRPNSDVVRPIYNGIDITKRWKGDWVVDFSSLSEEDAADYLAPFAHIDIHVKKIRMENKRAARAARWWQHGEKRPGMRAALQGLTHYIATVETAKHRIFIKLPVNVAPEHSLIVIPRQDDVTLGVLSSRVHVVWALAKGGNLGVGNDPRYNATLTFETFPFPKGVDLKASGTPNGKALAAVAKETAELSAWRELWLNPVEWVEWIQTTEEKEAGFPPRAVPIHAYESEWKKRTLTKLYNEMPGKLRMLHETLDVAVALAYGWDDYTPQMADKEILSRLLALNFEQSSPKPPEAKAA